ncbi:MAG: MBL fold metallo-hydrolase [Sedimentisphaerales bacterium]|nr:MBL fold metallo-hydrolase [Sedimentisphaerales bacterium]
MQIKLSFLGAAQNVTGSCSLLEAGGARILVDCGMYQERQFRDRNWQEFPVPPGTIDAVLLTHAHVDHCGLLPRLVQQGFQGKVFSTTATAEIGKIVLLDAAKLQVEDAEYKKRRHKKEGREGKYPVEPLYTVEDVEETIPLFSPVRYEQPVPVADGIEASFHDAGHILGASMIKLTLEKNGEKRIILYSGDVGRWDKPILRNPTVFEEADYVLVESTYGDRVHEDTENINDQLADIINATHQAGGNIVVPSFSVERSQELLYHINELLQQDRIPHLMTFLDSPMAIKVTEVFNNHPEMYDQDMKEMMQRNESPFELANLTMCHTSSESKAINHIKGTVIIIAGSGMCTGGRIKHHLVNNIERPESTIMFVGYQANGTLGRIILDGTEEVRILGQMHKVRARIARVHGFSGHADRDELMRWLTSLKRPPQHVFVVHGEAESAQNFSQYIHEKTGWQSSVPQYQQTVELE